MNAYILIDLEHRPYEEDPASGRPGTEHLASPFERIETLRPSYPPCWSSRRMASCLLLGNWVRLSLLRCEPDGVNWHCIRGHGRMSAALCLT
jgi:hypothetical protein